jgi:hypothetical protein
MILASGTDIPLPLGTCHFVHLHVLLAHDTTKNSPRFDFSAQSHRPEPNLSPQKHASTHRRQPKSLTARSLVPRSHRPRRSHDAGRAPPNGPVA